MSTPASIAKHPIHPMLIVFPIGLWIFSIVCHAVWLGGGGDAWQTVSMFNVAAGCIMALVAAVPGLVDLLSIPPSRARRVGVTHMVVNVTALVAFAISYYARLRGVMGATPFVVSLVGLVLIGVGGWLGGTMVYVHGVAVTGEGMEERRTPKDQIDRKDRPQTPGQQAA